jgi:hypothetical protein
LLFTAFFYILFSIRRFLLLIIYLYSHFFWRYRLKRLLLLAVFLAAPFAHADVPEAVSTLWRALSHAPGAAADTAALSQLFHADAVVFGDRYRNGQATLTATKGQDFIASLKTVRAAGFYECEVARDIKEYDRFATVYSVVESRTDQGSARADFVGVNSIQLYRTDSGWQIVSLYYHVERPGAPVSLGNGKSGVCL